MVRSPQNEGVERVGEDVAGREETTPAAAQRQALSQL
jgi:hypothetical protein